LSGFKRVYQENEEHGCGPAVVAMIAGVTFRDAEDTCAKYIANDKHHVGIRAISAPLKDLDAPYSCATTTVAFERKTRAAQLKVLEGLGKPAVVRTRSVEGVYHWLLWTGSELWDPLPPAGGKGAKAKSGERAKAGPKHEGGDFHLYKYRELETTSQAEGKI